MPGIVVTIDGTGFEKKAGQNIVTFAGPNNTSVRASVVSVSGSSLQVTVPGGAVTGAVSVKVGSQVSNGVTFTVPVNPAPVNRPPVVVAGSNQTITLPTLSTLSATVTDDGLPTGISVATVWSRVSGPGPVVFGNVNALSTTAAFSLAGTYVLRLTASDSLLSSTADVTITVNPAPP